MIVAAAILLCSCTTVSSDSSDWQSGNTDDTTPIFSSYSEFVDVKSERFGSFTKKVYSSKDLVLSAGPKLLSVSAIDLQFLPLSLLGNAEKADGSFSGNSKGYLNTVVTVKEDGVFDIEYDTYTGDKRESIYGSYNADSGYMSCKKTVDGIVTVSLEYLPIENGYLSQYRNYETGEIVRIGFTSDKFCLAIYDGSEYTELNKVAKEAFLQGAEVSIVEMDGTLEASIDGETIYA
jgi:hypothetical protein